MASPKIRIHGTSRVYEGNLTTSILNILLRNGFPIATICGGKAQCGKDIIRIKSGARFFSPRREREIALMASSRLSSRAIAAKLNLSVRTVSNHLGHIYAKLGVAGRRELAARLDMRVPVTAADLVSPVEQATSRLGEAQRGGGDCLAAAAEPVVTIDWFDAGNYAR